MEKNICWLVFGLMAEEGEYFVGMLLLGCDLG
jgi:hypothetical protein